MTSAVISQRVLPRTRAMSVVLVIAAAALTAIAAQWIIQLPFTPVPITGQTFAVLLTGAALGTTLGAAGQLLYVGVGALGLPVFAEGRGGWDVVSGPTIGYLLGFVIAAALIGYMAERRQDRTFATMFTAFFIGTVVIYTAGWIGLRIVADYGALEAFEKGVAPFVVGDILKAAAAGLLLPGAWRLFGDRSAGA